jgi:hypothetical protein
LDLLDFQPKTEADIVLKQGSEVDWYRTVAPKPGRACTRFEQLQLDGNALAGTDTETTAIDETKTAAPKKKSKKPSK